MFAEMIEKRWTNQDFIKLKAAKDKNATETEKKNFTGPKITPRVKNVKHRTHKSKMQLTTFPKANKNIYNNIDIEARDSDSETTRTVTASRMTLGTKDPRNNILGPGHHLIGPLTKC